MYSFERLCLCRLVRLQTGEKTEIKQPWKSFVIIIKPRLDGQQRCENAILDSRIQLWLINFDNPESPIVFAVAIEAKAVLVEIAALQFDLCNIGRQNTSLIFVFADPLSPALT